VQELLGEMEASYYSSSHRGRLVASHASDELRQLSELAMECAVAPRAARGGGAPAPALGASAGAPTTTAAS
jgi:hypothetical protein